MTKPLEQAIAMLKASGGSMFSINVPLLIQGLADASQRIEILEAHVFAPPVNTQPPKQA